MEAQLVESNLTILADKFNPSIFNEHWLKKYGIIDEDCEILSGSVFTSQFVHFMTNFFAATITQDQFQFIGGEELQIDPLIKIVNILPHIPYKALGINFNYLTPLTSCENQNIAKSLLAINDDSIFSEFQDDDCRFGIYLSRNYLESRLKLNVMPVTVNINNNIDEYIQCRFNFHHDLNQENASSNLLNFFDSYSKYKSYSLKMINKFGVKP